MNSRQIIELVIFVIYLLFMLAIGFWFFIRDKKENNTGEKTYFLGGRKMGAWVAALSAGASDMSGWVLMGLPASIYALGVGQIWISAGLAIGYTLSWIFEARRLRKFSIVSDDSITIPQYLTNRFKSKSRSLQLICAVVFLVAYTVYAASSVKACGTLFEKVLGIDPKISMIAAAVIIVGYTFLGGYSAVCWTDFFQGMLILGAMLLAPIFALVAMGDLSAYPITGSGAENYWNAFGDWKAIVSGLGWGLGYFGMPHIIVRFMSLKSDKELKKSRKIGISWTVIIVILAAFIGIASRMYLGFDQEISDAGKPFIEMVDRIFPAAIAGLLLSAVLAASMSTADSQLLAASSAFSSDVYKPIIKKGKVSDKGMMWVGRIVVVAVAVVALIIALAPGTGTIMSLVENAWGVFGAAFGPAIMLSLFWKRFNYQGAVAGIVVGAAVDIALCALALTGTFDTGIYEIIPGTAAGLIAAVVTTLCTKAPTQEVEELFDKAVAYED